MFRLAISTLTTGFANAIGATVKTVAALLPLTVTRLVSVAPLPLVRPWMMVLEGTFSVPLVRVMVAPDPNAEEAKVMLAPPALAAAASASRSVQVPSGEPVQFDAVPVASSAAVFTTKLGAVMVSVCVVSLLERKTPLESE